MRLAILRAGGDTRTHTERPARRNRGGNDILLSLRAREAALEDADEIRVKVIGFMRDFYCRMMAEPKWMQMLDKI